MDSHALCPLLPLLILLILAALPTTQAATPVFQFGTPTFFGTGCPRGSLQVVPSTDAQSVAMLFSAFTAETSQSRRRTRQTCNLVLPVTVQSGVSLGVYRLDYRGYVYVPEQDPQASAQFEVEYFFSGARGPTLDETWAPGTDEDVTLSSDLGVSAIVWSPCRSKTVFRINASVRAARGSPQGDPQTQEQTFIGIDSADISVQQSARFFLTYKPCTA